MPLDEAEEKAFAAIARFEEQREAQRRRQRMIILAMGLITIAVALILTGVALSYK